MIIDGSLKLASKRCRVMLRWVPAHQGIEGNEVADGWAKEAARGDGEGMRSEGAEASLSFLKRTTKEERNRKTKE
jgi:ribonuclease HI